MGESRMSKQCALSAAGAEGKADRVIFRVRHIEA